jgi:GTP-binding protein SAR1
MSSWLWGWVDWFWHSLIRGRKAKILFLGLDNAGKTTLLHLLHDGHIHQHQPTGHATSEEMQLGNLRITVIDMGGHKAARQIWRNYYTTVDAIVFLVDAADPKRLLEAKQELDLLLQDDAILMVPILVLGNKIDRPGSLSDEYLRQQLFLGAPTSVHGLGMPYSGPRRPIELFMCSLVKNQGYGEGFNWLASCIKQ